MILHNCHPCFISKDEVELQQDEENLPYEEEIYKDSSTFLKVSHFAIRSVVTADIVVLKYFCN